MSPARRKDCSTSLTALSLVVAQVARTPAFAVQAADARPARRRSRFFDEAAAIDAEAGAERRGRGLKYFVRVTDISQNITDDCGAYQ